MTLEASAQARSLRSIAFLFATLTALIPRAIAGQADHTQPLPAPSAAALPAMAAQHLAHWAPPETAQAPAALARRSQNRKPVSSAADPTSPLFLPVVAYDTGDYYAGSVAVGDLNGDGKPDLVVSDSNGFVGVLLGNGDGTFQSVVKYPVYSISAVAVADVNGDGKLDVVTANQCVAANECDSGTISVLLGNGDGTLQAAVNYPAGPGMALALAVADLNHDGKPDVAVTLWSGLAGILLGNGDGTFQPVVTYDAGADSDSMTIADLNADGVPDLLIGTETAVSVLYGNGDGTFQPRVDFSASIPGDTPVGIGTVVVADVNGDGKPDIIAANQGSGTNHDGSAAVLLGNGNGTFQPVVNYDSGGNTTWSVAVADINLDGKLDLVVTNYGVYPTTPGSVGVLLGNGDGTFQPAITYYSGGIFAISLAIADLNGDHLPDVAVANQAGHYGNPNDGTVGVLLNSNTNAGLPTVTTLASRLNPSTFGQSVTFVARVTSNSGTPSGTVQILYGSAVVGSGTLVKGVASIPVSTAPVGTDSITASYLGATGFASSTSAAVIQTVTQATTSTSLAASSSSVVANLPVTFTAVVTGQYGGAATGTVRFASGSKTLGTAPLTANQASLTTSFTTTGTYSVTAEYTGDLNNVGSSSGAVKEVVLAPTSISLASSLNPSLMGQNVVFTATLSSPGGTPPDGETIAFYNKTTFLGSAPLSAGSAALATTALPAGILSITASYAGDSNFGPSVSAGLRQVVQSNAKSPTTTTIASSLNPAIYGQTLSLTAQVTTTGPQPPTGGVLFTWSDGVSRYTIGLAKLNSSGTATLTKSTLNAGDYPITALYEGDPNNAKSTSPLLDQTVLQATSRATIRSSQNPSTSGQPVTFTANITSPTATPSGPVTFKSGTTVLGVVQLSSGKATFTTSSLPAGVNKIRVVFSGDSDVKPSAALVEQDVNP